MSFDFSFVKETLGSRAVGAAALVLVVLAVGAVLRRALTARIEDVDLRYRTRKGVTSATWALALLLAAGQFSDALSGLGAAIGIAGAGIAFALQEVIASAAGWLAVRFGSFFTVGDRVQLGGIKGDVIDIGILRTTLMEVGQWVDGDLYNGRVVRVANSFVFKEPVFNYSAGFPFLWDEIKVPVRYGSDAALARETLTQISVALTQDSQREAAAKWAQMVREFRLEAARLEPMVTMALNDNWMEFTVRYIVHFQRRRTTRDLLFQRVLAAFDAAPERLALASATFQVVGLPPLDLQVRRGAIPPDPLHQPAADAGPRDG